MRRTIAAIFIARPRRGLPVLEGKHIEPFRVHVDRSTLESLTHARTAARRRHHFLRARLAYRDVASSTNRLSLIAAVFRPGVVTTHSLFCLKTQALGQTIRRFLCAMLNSYVANYLVRQVMTTHLGSATVEALRVPKPRYDSPAFEEHRRAGAPAEPSARWSSRHYARLQALAAACYGLTVDEFAHVLDTFPLIDAAERRAALNELRDQALLK